MNFMQKIFSRKSEVKGNIVANDYLSMLNAIHQGLSGQAGKSGIVKKIGFIRENLWYLTNSAVSSSVDTIAEKFSEIVPVIKNPDTGEIIRKHPVLDLLAQPNKSMTREDFMFKYGAYYLINGNAFLNGIGLVALPPNELSLLRPDGMNFSGSTNFDRVESYQYTSDVMGIKYDINEDGAFARYFTRSNTAELWPVKMFNPDESATNAFGVSLMNSIQLEIEQFTQANVHNLAVLNNGARMSGILTTEGNLTKDQRDFIVEQFKAFQEGASNAGRTLFAEGGGGKINYNQLSQNAKDMDFKELRNQNKLYIHARYKVPLPLVSPDHMTMNNYSEARLALYDESVIPLTNALYGELQKFLFPKYSDLKNSGLVLSYDEQDILPLKQRSDASIKSKQETGAFTLNEIRNMHGKDPLEGGDVIYQPNSLVPLGSSPVELDDTEKQLVNILRKSND